MSAYRGMGSIGRIVRAMDIFARGSGCTRTLWILTPPYWTVGKCLDFRSRDSRLRWKSLQNIAKRLHTYSSQASKFHLEVLGTLSC